MRGIALKDFGRSVTIHRKTRLAKVSPIKLWREVKGPDRLKVCQAGAVIVRRGATAERVYLIERGAVKLIRLKEDGEDAVVGLRGPGWILGAAAAFFGRSYAATAVTLNACRLAWMSAKEFRHRLETDVNFSLWVHQVCFDELFGQPAQTELWQYSGRQRLENFLWELMVLGGVPDPTEPIKLELPLTYEEIGQLIGVTREYAGQLFKDLVRDGLLVKDKGWHIVPDPQKLWRQMET
jgi:CRP/FNR family transcriptional regulator